MISLKVLSTAAAMALVVPMVAPIASFAQSGFRPAPNQLPGAGAPAAGGGGARLSGGGGAPAGSGFRAAPQQLSGGAPAGFRPAPNQLGSGVARYSGAPAGFRPASPQLPNPQVSGGGPRYSGGYGGGYHRHHRGGFGFGTGVAIGGAYGYYGSDYYAPGYYDDQYYDDSAAVAVAPEGGDDVAYCSQRYRSYDPQSGTYLGSDGYRHPCP